MLTNFEILRFCICSRKNCLANVVSKHAYLYLFITFSPTYTMVALSLHETIPGHHLAVKLLENI